MRSRTELVTTTFIDSEEEQTESDDSEEDWRPESSRNGKKRQSKGKRRNKRKAATAPKLMAKKKLIDSVKEQQEDSDDGDYPKIFPPTSLSQGMMEQKSLPGKKIEEKSTAATGLFNLYLYKKDLDKDYRSNSHLCLWRRDGSSLLQKYIRVKTNNCEEFIFTSSSVYSSWDERRRKDFATVGVKCMEDNNRRVIIQDAGILQILSDEMAKRRLEKTEGISTKADEDSSNEMLDSQEDEGDYEDDDEEEEMSGEEDANSAKTSDGDDDDDDYYEGDEGSTNEGTSHPSTA